MSAAMWLAWGGMAGVVGVYGWVWAMAGERGRQWLEWGLAVFVAAVSAVSVLTHEPWADELHAWLKTRDLTVWQLWKEMPYEGHVIPWHLVLHPFARWGAPVETMGWISWAINAAAVAWFSRKAPFAGWAKAAAMLSCVFLYVNPVIARPYVLIPPVLFALAELWRKRDERPVAFGALVALLANTHVCMGGLAGMVFLVFAWENVLRRKDGKGWRECRRGWAGLAMMAAGGALAVVQLLPSLWKSGTKLGPRPDGFSLFLQRLPSVWGVLAVATGLAWLGMVAWRRDKGVFWTLAGSLGFLLGISLAVWPATPVNRALLWWPMALWAAWALAAGAADDGKRRSWGLSAAVAAMALTLVRPDMTWQDLRRDYDPLPGACRFIAARYGKDAEVWINGQNYLAEGTAAYLDNLWDWQTRRRAERIRFTAGSEYLVEPFWVSKSEIFRLHPEKEGILALVILEDGSGLMPESARAEGMEVVYLRSCSVLDNGVMVVRVPSPRVSGNGREMRVTADIWMQMGMERSARGDREGAMAAWKRAVEEDAERWEAMNNLAWVFAKAGKVAEAREWIDRAMACEGAQESAGAWDTEAEVRRAEGNEAGAREAEERRDALKGRQEPAGDETHGRTLRQGEGFGK